jgi:hypothetical protein
MKPPKSSTHCLADVMDAMMFSAVAAEKKTIMGDTETALSNISASTSWSGTIRPRIQPTWMTIKRAILAIYWDVYYGLGARLGWLYHRVRHPRHAMRWRTHIDAQCPGGDITCETCDAVYWCRAMCHNVIWSWICGRKGHVSSAVLSGGWTTYNPLTEQCDVPCDDPPLFCVRCGVRLTEAA